MVILAQETARHRALDEGSRGALVVEELLLIQRFVARLLGHFLLAAA